ncbi:MAG: preprotein translocase subunit Sec61beta [Candidatus Aenigmarchaeota archaeon]|nr:preprotein translocase subunit Sec61beta [Candidatus Aenigmarchaeota archaeon]
MAKQRIQQPQGMAGLIRYFDEEKSIIKLKPKHIIEIIVLIIILEIFLTNFI